MKIERRQNVSCGRSLLAMLPRQPRKSALIEVTASSSGGSSWSLPGVQSRTSKQPHCFDVGDSEIFHRALGSINREVPSVQQLFLRVLTVLVESIEHMRAESGLAIEFRTIWFPSPCILAMLRV